MNLKKGIKNGILLEAKLPDNWGVAYLKYLHSVTKDGEEVVLSAVKAYNYVGPPLSDYSGLNDDDLLFGYRKIAGIFPTIRKGFWRIVGQSELLSEENYIPDFKRFYPSLPNFEADANKFCFISNNEIQPEFFTDQMNVRHLERSDCTGTGALEIRIVMEYLRVNGRDIKEYFKLDEFIEKFMMDDVLSRPVYSSVPKEIRGKALLRDKA